MRGASARFFSLFYTTILAHCTKQTVPASCHDCRRQAVGINRSSAPKALSAVCLKGLNALKGFKDLSGPTQNRRPRPSGTPSNLEGDVHGAAGRAGKCRKGKKGKLRRIGVFFGNSHKFHYVCAMVNKRSAPLRVGN